jgi:undecaprenyl-diphosphatase
MSLTHLQAIAIAFVEGVTEFLPVSSTFHMLQAASLMGLGQNDFLKMFVVVVQSGAVASIFFVFRREVWFANRLYSKVLLSTIPVLVAGFLLRDFVKNTLFESREFTTFVFIGVGVVFLMVEWWIGKRAWSVRKNLVQLGYLDALLIGLAQCLALIPGVSRSGAVLVAMLMFRYRRDEAAAYSLAMAIPVIFIAGAYDMLSGFRTLQLQYSLALDVLALGVFVSFLVGYLSAKWLVQYLKDHTLRVFGVYRIVVGIALLIITKFFGM